MSIAITDFKHAVCPWHKIVSLVSTVKVVQLHKIRNKSLQSKFIGSKYCFKIGRSSIKTVLSLREAATVNSISGAQGYTRCQCKTKCKTNRCACRSESRICNSKCHGSLSCENKNFCKRMQIIKKF